MNKFLKISLMMAVAIATSRTANSETPNTVSALKLLKQDSSHTIPIPPPQPGNPHMPLG